MKTSPVFPPYYSAGDWTFASPFVFVPTLLLVFMATAGGVRYLQAPRRPSADTQPLSAFSRLIAYLTLLVVLSYMADAAVLVSRAFIEGTWTSAVLAYSILASYLAWTLALIMLVYEAQVFRQWYWIQYAFWLLAALLDATTAWTWTMAVKHPRNGTVFTVYDRIWLSIFIARYIVEVLVCLLAMTHMFVEPRLPTQDLSDDEREPLLGGNQARGTTSTSSPPDTDASGIANFMNKMKQIFPYIWPHNNLRLQSLIFLCFILMILGMVVNVLTSRQIGLVVDEISDGPGKFAWAVVSIYVGYRFLQGGSGLIQACQNWLWVPVQQNTSREISIRMFEHLHSLSLAFHINRKTGEVLRVMDRGTNSVVQLLQQIVFQMFPAIANILVAVVFFTIHFSFVFGLIVFVTMGLYLFVTIRMTTWRTKFRREMNQLDNEMRTKAVDSLLNFETVKYYGAESFEVDRYRSAIFEYQKADWKSSISLNLLNLAQNAVISLGLLVGSVLCAWEVAQGRFTAGDYVTFNAYLNQLYSPLHFFGTYYRMIQQNFIDMEKMLELFQEEESVKDSPDATQLVVKQGEVVFDNVIFSYDGRQTALKGISFTVPAGKTVALVGPSGSGKSTILRLLFRFYDPSSGSISIDGQDIRLVKQESLRKNVGVVPQDTVLFNDTVMYNIRYGDVNATDEHIVQAAKAAQIHDSIMQFPDGYETKVGERGLRLSGGEKQRLAIARTIVKNPPVILLDEATSALDTTTERHIQDALTTMTKDRTTLVIAHRLSTIVNADIILVIKDGRVAESGTHEELIRQGMESGSGIYYEMWEKQLDDGPASADSSTLATEQDA
ncbi:P-loop containing nucleoside triphosphate hydrolase protein [Gongronella butleri]|nr:P-loop containing nucleoside triphosphate hydrolase protein [Gongronella butleri]